MGMRFKTAWTVNPTTRRSPWSSSPTRENVAGRPSEAQAMTKKRLAKTAATEDETKRMVKPAVLSAPKRSSARRVPSRSDTTPPG